MSGRFMIQQLQIKHCKLNIIRVYASTADKPDEETFYEQIPKTLKPIKLQDITLSKEKVGNIQLRELHQNENLFATT